MKFDKNNLSSIISHHQCSAMMLVDCTILKVHSLLKKKQTYFFLL